MFYYAKGNKISIVYGFKLIFFLINMLKIKWKVSMLVLSWDFFIFNFIDLNNIYNYKLRGFNILIGFFFRWEMFGIL